MKLILATQIAADIEPHLPAEVQVVHVDDQGQLDGDASEAEVYAYSWSLRLIIDKVLNAAPQLRWLHTPSAGVDHLLTPLLLERDLLLTNGAGLHAIPVAEFVLALLLNHAKLLPKLQVAQAEHHWLWDLKPLELQDATLLLLGLGGLGQAIAQRAAAFGMRIWGSRRNPEPLPGIERVVGAQAWRALLPEVDYLVVTTPLTPQTRGLIDADALRSLRPSAYLVNVARGPVVDEAALIRALREGWLAGAALDTFSVEPLPSDHPLWSLPNVYITPHCAADSPRVRQRMTDLFLDNLGRYRAGLPLRNLVDKQAGY